MYAQPKITYADHTDAAKLFKVPLIKNKTHLKTLSNKDKLEAVSTKGTGYRVAKLTHSSAFLVPKGNIILQKIAKDFYKKSGKGFFVVTSLTRTMSDQQRLRTVNVNASPNESAHNFGAAFDISYVRFNNKKKWNSKLDAVLESILKKYQKSGDIYYIKEKLESCYHITVRK
ncbi:MAG: hypothetical protein E6Q89_06380 [Bacteroidia bacterium]|nr:MAG: hypothetical protein E6Q89_06380 [Bacteroidia bacterium]